MGGAVPFFFLAGGDSIASVFILGLFKKSRMAFLVSNTCSSRGTSFVVWL